MLTYGFVCPQMYFTAKQGKKMVKTTIFFLKTPREEVFLNTIIFILCMAVWNLKQGKIDLLCLVPTKIDIVDTSILKRFVFPQSISSFKWTNYDIWICYVSLKTWKRHALLLASDFQ